MLDIALLHSNVCNTIILRGGSALDAQSKLQANLSLPVSLPLADEQWKVEVRAMFKASLARIQIDLRDYARGAAANKIGYKDHTDSAYQDMCSSYKFRTVGWKNVNAWGFWLLIILVVAVYILSFETPRFGEEEKLIVESLWDGVAVKSIFWLGGKCCSSRREENAPSPAGPQGNGNNNSQGVNHAGSSSST